ncbi:hypothetical protein R3P38DRAFT_3464656 [Favolaschia claudopus]|uniref:F-box domain-containing protein n=1 Tax=Favolaschia claudopus TaxID=2862362 RepID=A0AAV9ZF96_9AGAR
MQRQNPIEVNELLDHCISALAPSASILSACALVSRSWAEIAQFHLFRAPHLTNPHCLTSDALLLKLYTILTESPRLLRHIRENMQPRFTNLKTVALSTIKLIPSAFINLLESPHLRRLEFAHHNRDFASVMHVWERCSPAIRHLDLCCYRGVGAEYIVLEKGLLQRITLKSLQLEFGIDSDEPFILQTWTLAPFDLSRLKALSIKFGTTLFLPSHEVEILELDIGKNDEAESYDLSSFTNLHILRINISTHIPNSILHTLRTANSELLPHLHTIVVGISGIVADSIDWQSLDWALSAFPRSLAMAEFDVQRHSREEVQGMLPDLMTRNLLRFIPTLQLTYQERRKLWWQEVTERF